MMKKSSQANLSTDVLSEILESLRLCGSVFFSSKLSAPWGIALPNASEPRFHIVIEGSAWLHSAKLSEPLELVAGTAILLRDGEQHWIADHPDSPKVSSEAASRAFDGGQPLFQGATTDCHLLCGSFRSDRGLGHPLLETLPELSLIGDEGGRGLEWIWQTAKLMERELNHVLAGRRLLMDRICELFLIQLLRHLLDQETQSAGFITALDDGYISRALNAIHAEPARSWSIADLANIAGLSRSAFARRFHDLVGIPPKTYLTMWRMHQARKLLRNPYKMLAEIAREVGYASDVALIRAFQRYFGKSPKQMRRELASESQT